MDTLNDWQMDTLKRGLAPAWFRCLRAATLAPSVHNTQPWLFRVEDDHVDVFADHRRRLDVIDPRGRELTISVGGALFNLRVAMLAEGRQPLIQPWPDPAHENLVARVTLGPAVTADATVRALHAAIPLRRTNRRAFADQQLPEHLVADLVQAAQVEGAGFAQADETGRLMVLGVVRRAEEQLRANQQYRAELASWVHDDDTRSDGVPLSAVNSWAALESVPLRDFGEITDIDLENAVFEPRPNIAVLYTHGDTPPHWLRAGQALERVLLTATVRGAAATLMTQPMELPTLRALLADPRDDSIVAQVALRFGYAPPSPATPRRPLHDVVVKDLPVDHRVR